MVNPTPPPPQRHYPIGNAIEYRITDISGVSRTEKARRAEIAEYIRKNREELKWRSELWAKERRDAIKNAH